MARPDISLENGFEENSFYHLNFLRAYHNTSSTFVWRDVPDIISDVDANEIIEKLGNPMCCAGGYCNSMLIPNSGDD